MQMPHPFAWPALAVGSLILVSATSAAACDDCSLHAHLATSQETHSHDDSHGHSHSHNPDGTHSSNGGFSQILSFRSPTADMVSDTLGTRGSSDPITFAVIGDTQGGEFGGHGNLLTRLVERVSGFDPDYVLFPGDLVANSGASGWQAWKNTTSSLGNRRLMTPGNHDVGPGATFANWQNTFDWLPDSQALNGQRGVDQVDYFVDQGNVRFVSISTDAPGQYYNSRQINSAPPALDWMREVMADVENRNSDAEPNNNIDHVFTFSHRPVTTQLESPTGGTNGDWWRSMTGQDPSSNTVSTAFLPGHWHMYQPSRPDPNVDTMEIISGTGGGGLEGQPHRNRHGFTLITVDGPGVTAQFYGDENQSGDTWDFELLDSYTIRQAGGLPTGELARYAFEPGAINRDSSTSSLSKGHDLHFVSGASVINDPIRGSVLSVDGAGANADAKNIGDNNLAVLRDLTISFFAKADTLASGDGENTLVAFGAADGSWNETLNDQESANFAYKVSITAAGNLQFGWQHDDGVWEAITSNDSVDDPLAWHEYEFQRDADSRGVGFFVDGEQLGQLLAFDFLPTGSGSGSLTIGASAGGVRGFDGLIDDLRISSAEVSIVPAILGDFNSDGVVDSQDWLLYAVGLGADDPGDTDLNGDGVNNHVDFVRFQQIYNNHNGNGSFTKMRANVPEPSSLLLLFVACAMICNARHRIT